MCGFILFAACGLFCLHRADFFARSVRIFFVCSVRIFLFVVCGLFSLQRADLFCSQCEDLFSLQCILFCEMCNFLLYGGILPGNMCPLWASVLSDTATSLQFFSLNHFPNAKSFQFMNFSEAMFYENYLTSDFHTNTVISSLFAYSSKWRRKP